MSTHREAASADCVEREQDPAPVPTPVLEKVTPDGALAPIRPPRAAHGQAVVEQPRVARLIPGGHVADLEEGGVLGRAPRRLDEAARDHPAVVASLEGVGLLAGAGVAVEVFLLASQFCLSCLKKDTGLDDDAALEAAIPDH